MKRYLIAFVLLLVAGVATATTVTKVTGIVVKTCSSSNWVSALAATGILTCSQPAFSDISGTATAAQVTATQRLAIGWDAGLDPGASGSENVIATIDQASTVQDIRGTVAHTVGSAATLSVNKAASGTACSAGTTLHSGSFDANGTAATNQTLTVTTSALSAGDRLCLVTTNGSNWTGGTGVGGITVRITTP